MSREGKVVEDTNKLNTIETLKEDFRNLGIKKDMTLIVHSSLSSIGWVNGGAVSVIDALIQIIGKDGTIIMPSQTGDLSDPKDWEKPPVPLSWHQEIRDTMPAFDVKKTPTRSMGVIVETFRKYKGVRRSNHPQVSFIAWGKNRDYILKNQKLDYGLNDKSPLGKMYRLDTKVLLIGVDYDNNTSFHLAEYNSNLRKEIKQSAPIIEDGKRVWKEFKDIDLDTEHFNEIGREFEKEHEVVIGRVGQSRAKLFSQKECVDFATEWMKNNEDKMIQKLTDEESYEVGSNLAAKTIAKNLLDVLDVEVIAKVTNLSEDDILDLKE